MHCTAPDNPTQEFETHWIQHHLLLPAATTLQEAAQHCCMHACMPPRTQVRAISTSATQIGSYHSETHINTHMHVRNSCKPHCGEAADTSLVAWGPVQGASVQLKLASTRQHQQQQGGRHRPRTPCSNPPQMRSQVDTARPQHQGSLLPCCPAFPCMPVAGLPVLAFPHTRHATTPRPSPHMLTKTPISGVLTLGLGGSSRLHIIASGARKHIECILHVSWSTHKGSR